MLVKRYFARLFEAGLKEDAAGGGRAGEQLFLGEHIFKFARGACAAVIKGDMAAEDAADLIADKGIMGAAQNHAVHPAAIAADELFNQGGEIRCVQPAALDALGQSRTGAETHSA